METRADGAICGGAGRIWGFLVGVLGMVVVVVGLVGVGEEWRKQREAGGCGWSWTAGAWTGAAAESTLRSARETETGVGRGP
jgi:hypothetical protein